MATVHSDHGLWPETWSGGRYRSILKAGHENFINYNEYRYSGVNNSYSEIKIVIESFDTIVLDMS